MRTRRVVSLLVLTFSFMLLGTLGAQGAAASSALSPGDSGPEVYRLQTTLEEWRPGIMNGSVGGQTTARYGPRTLNAVHEAARELRGHQNPSPTYTVGPLFWNALESAVGGSTAGSATGSTGGFSGGGSSGGSTAGDAAASAARALVGSSYAWGGTGPSFDCSGLVQRAWRQAGVHLPRVSRDQFASGTRVSRANARAGDIVAHDFSGNGVVDHVGVYLGNGRQVDASASLGRVVERGIFDRSLVGFSRPG